MDDDIHENTLSELTLSTSLTLLTAVFMEICNILCPGTRSTHNSIQCNVKYFVPC